MRLLAREKEEKSEEFQRTLIFVRGVEERMNGGEEEARGFQSEKKNDVMKRSRSLASLRSSSSTMILFLSFLLFDSVSIEFVIE